MTEPRGDAAFRKLEHDASESPHDGTLRVRLARELVRIERRRDALAALDLESFPETGFLEARALADELWDYELAALGLQKELPFDGRVTQSAIDPTGRYVAALLEPRRVVLDDTVTRERLETEGSPGDLPFGALAFSSDACTAYPGGGSLLRIPLLSPLEAERVPFEGLLLGGSPDGRLLYLAGVTRWGIYAWPGLTPVFERARSRTALNREVGEGASVSWDSQRLLVDAGERYEVLDFSGKLVTSVERPRPLSAWFVGRGLLALTAGELTLLDLASGARLQVLSGARGLTQRPALAIDGRSAHVLLGGRPRRVLYDFARATLVPAEGERQSWLEGESEPDAGGSPGFWHPVAGAVALWRSGDIEIRSLSGTLTRIPGARPRGWSQDGHALLVDRWTETGTRLEVWRTPSTRRATGRVNT